MSTFTTITPIKSILDPYKRVKYTNGLILGVDEFVQEELYLSEKNRLHNRALHGYGTICGLDVSIQQGDTGPEVIVAPGLAINPQGQEIRVSAAQCAQLNAWLAHHQAEVLEQLGSPPDPVLSLYVTLCYRECETDLVPIPGEPCRSQEKQVVPSRIADDFELRLSWTPSAQIEETTIRRFGDLLAQIVITADGTTFLTQLELEDLVRGLASDSLPLHHSSPPLPNAPFCLHPDEACEMLRVAFRVWATEVRPVLLSEEKNCATGQPDERCIHLAQLDFAVAEVEGTWQVDGLVTLNQDDRPILLQTRLLQEWLLCSPPQWKSTCTFVSLAVLKTTPPDVITIRAWLHHPTQLNVPNDAVSIAFNDRPIGHDRVTIRQTLPQTNVWDLEVQGTFFNGDRITVRFDTQRLTEVGSPHRILSETLKNGECRYGDREGNHIVGYLTVPEQIPRAMNLVTITRLDDMEYEFWFHTDNLGALLSLSKDDFTVHMETIDKATFSETVDIDNIDKIGRNVFAIELDREATWLNFQFFLWSIRLENGQTLQDFAMANQITFIGYNGNDKLPIVTLPIRVAK